MSEQSTNPFAPQGLRQAQAAQEGRANPFSVRGTTDGDAAAKDNPFSAKQWFTGGNTEDTANGWNTPFFEKMFSQHQRAVDEGKTGSFFDYKDATGIVTYDHGRTADGKNNRHRFGDVYEDGKRVGNVYESYDPATADMLMAQLTIDPKALPKIFAEKDPNAIAKAVNETRRRTEKDAEKWLTAQDFQNEADAQHKEWTDAGSGATVATIAAGAAGGAATFGGLGAVLAPFTGGASIPIFAAVGAASGGFGAWLNRDELIGQAARAKVQTDMLEDQFGDGFRGRTAQLANQVGAWGGLGMKAISPASNLLHGIYDSRTEGGTGDRVAGFYDTNDEGERLRAGWLQAADVGTMLLDATGQFGSKAGALLFQGAMGSTITGKVGTLTATGGYSFDDRRGDFDLITRDDEGNFDLGALSAGIGEVGIDALQLGMARGITTAANSSAATVRAMTDMPAAAGIANRISELAGRTGGRTHVGGMSVVLDDAGRAVAGSLRPSLSVLAPSEAVQGLSAAMRARRLAAKDGAAMSADDFYRAATEMATGSRKFTNALINGFGESTEEALQAILEPLSHNARPDLEEIVNAAMSGFGMGMGMTFGAQSQGASSDDRMFAQAYVTQGALGQGELSRDAWSKMSPTQKQALTVAPPYVQKFAQEAARKAASAQRATAVANTPMLEKFVDAARRVAETELSKMAPRTDGAFVITQLADAGTVDSTGAVTLESMPNHAVGSSFTTLRLNLGQRIQGLRTQLEALRLGDTRTPIAVPAALKVADPATAIALAERTLQQSELLMEFIQAAQRQIDGALAGGSTQALRQVINDTNRTLRQWFNGEAGAGLSPEVIDARMRAASQLYIRDPQDQAGSYQLLLPQASFELTRAGADSVLQVSHSILQAIGGDYDGDKIRAQAQLILAPEPFANLRTGMNLLGAMGSEGGSVNIMTRPYEEYEVTQLSNALKTTGALAANARDTQRRMRAALEARYASSAIPAADLKRVLDRFARDIRDGDGKARARLLDSLAEFGSEMTEFARSTMTNEWLWVDQVVQSNLQRFQRISAQHTPRRHEINTTNKAPISQTSEYRQVLVEAAANDAINMSIRAEGHSLFRMFQKLHYSDYNALVEGTQVPGTDLLAELTEMYEELAQGMTRSALDSLDAVDEIMSRVQFQLRAVAADAVEQQRLLGVELSLASSMAIVANMAMPWLDNNGTLHTGTTLVQGLLARETQRFATEHAASMTPELSAKIDRYKRMYRPGQAEQAFVEVLGPVPLYELLGPDAEILGSNLTVEQFTRQYLAQDTHQRQDTKRILHAEAQYLGRESTENIPYKLKELDPAKLQVSAYRSVVDSMLGAAHKRLSIDGSGVPTGEFVDRSNRYQEKLVQGFAQVQAALDTVEGFRKGVNRKDPEAARAWMSNFMETNPEWARSVLELIPDSATSAVFTVVESGSRRKLLVSPWVYDMLLMRDPKEAAMHYWRSVTLAKWNALGGNTNAADTDSKARTYSELDSRFHQLLYQLANAGDNGIRMMRLMTQMQEAKDLDEFFKVVNTKFRGSQAPFLPWLDDVAEFSPDKAQFGLSPAMPGALMREAILDFQKRSDRLVTALNSEREAQIADEATMTALGRAIADGENASEADRTLLARAKEVLRFAQTQRTTMGPGMQRSQTAGSLMHFFGKAHTKGISPWPYVPIGAFEALGDSLGFATPFGQHERAVVGTQDAEDIGGNMAMGARDSLESMTADGTPIVWEQLTIERLVKIWRERPEAAPAIRAVLFPSVWERTESGKISQQFLSNKSISDLLSRNTYEEMLENTPRGRQLYTSMLEGRAKNHAGNYPVMRLANNLVLSRLSSKRKQVTPEEAEEMTLEAYDQIADVMKIIGEIASGDPKYAGEALQALRSQLRKSVRLQQAGSLLGLRGPDAQDLTETIYQSLLTDKERELAERIADLGTNQEVIDTLIADHKTMVRRVELLLSEAPFQTVAESYTIPWGDPRGEASRKQEIIEYVRTHPYLSQRASWAKTELSELSAWILDPGVGFLPDLPDKTWDTISRAIIGSYLDEMSSDSAIGMSIPVYPDASKEKQLRFWDPTFAYLLDDLFDPAMVSAAAELHTESGRRGVRNATGSLVHSIMEKIFTPGSLGTWTSDLPRLLGETNARLDAAAAADAVAMAGLSPVNEAAESAATRRTFELPPPEAFALATVDFNTLMGGQAAGEVTVDRQGVTELMPLLRMNGRFARGAVLNYEMPDGSTGTVDLWNTRPHLGRPYVQNEAALNSGLRSFTVNQLRKVAGRALPQGATLTNVAVEIVHPDAQPAQGYANNLFFEGTSFELDADSQPSLNATLWFAPGSVSPNEQAKALQANKSGRNALEVTETMLSKEREQHESMWKTDFAAMLTYKTLFLMTTDLGSGRFQPAFFNAVYKRQKMRHFVRGFLPGDDGVLAPALWTAEQVIAFQRAQPGVPLPLQNAELWKPSPKAVRTMLGEVGAQGTLLLPNGQPEVDITRIPLWTGDPKTVIERLPGALEVDEDGAFVRADLLDTPAAQRTFQSQRSSTPPLSRKQRNDYAQALTVGQARKADIHVARQSQPGFKTDLAEWRSKHMSEALNSLDHATTALDMRDAGLPFIGPRQVNDPVLSAAVLREMHEVLNEDELRAVWMFRAGDIGGKTPVSGVFNESSIARSANEKGPRHLHLAPDDITVVDLESLESTYAGSAQKATSQGEKALRHMMAARTIILLPDGRTGGDLRHDLSQYLREHGYTNVPGSRHLFRPVPTSETFANPRARLSTLTETYGISAQSSVMLFHSRALQIAENAAWVLNPGKRRPVAVSADLVPTNLFGRFNVPVEPAQVAAVQQTLLSMDARTKEMLLESMGAKPRSKEAREFDAALNELFSNWDADPENPRITPRRGAPFGTGSIIPLLDPRTNDIFLMRHGHDLPRNDDLVTQLSRAAVPGERRQGIAVSSTKVNSGHTTHRGEVVEFRPRSQYGLSALLRVDLQEFGDKLQLEGNGMKLVLTEAGDHFVLPDHGVFEDWPIDLAVNWDDTMSKESFPGLVDNFRNAIAYFGADFRPELVKGIFGVDLDTLPPDEQARKRTQLNDVLLAVQRGRSIPVAVAYDLMRMQNPEAYVSDLLSPLAQIDGVSSLALSQLTTPNATPEQQITLAALLYLSTPQAQVEHILEAGGFNAAGARTGTGLSIMMPPLFTDTLDRASFGSPLRLHMINKINEQIHNPTAAEGYYLAENFQLHISSKSGEYTGWLQFSEAHSSGDNPVLNDQAFSRSNTQQVSAHSLDIAFQAIGARTSVPKALTKTNRWLDREGLVDWTGETDLWDVLRATPEKDTTFQEWRTLTPAEVEYKSLARAAIGDYRKELDREGWTTEEVAAYELLRNEVALAFGLTERQSPVVDYWIRQMLGQPLGAEDAGRISHRNAMETMELELLWNAQNGYLPTAGAEVPQLHYNDLSMLHRSAEARGASGFQLREEAGSDTRVTSWEDWVHIALGQGSSETDVFDPLFRLPNDGFMHSYIDAIDTLIGLPVSRDMLFLEQLFDPETSRMVMSLDPNQDLLLGDATILDNTKATLSALMGGQRMAGGTVKLRDVPASVRARRVAARRRWRKEHNVPQLLPMTMRNFRETGAMFETEGTTTNALMRIAINLRVGNALFNPFLWISAIAETTVRGALDDATNLLMGDAMNATGRLTSRYNAEQRKMFGRLVESLGGNAQFKGMVYRELHFNLDKMSNAGRIERWTHNFARFGSSIQDPTYGMRGNTLARRYYEAVLKYVQATPFSTTLTMETLVANSILNPTWVRDHHPDAHKAAMATIANVRSLKPTVLSLMARGLYEPLSSNPHMAVNMPSTLFLKLPLMFSNYGLNVTTNILGLQGVNAMLAAWFDGRSKGKLGRLQAFMAGRDYDPETDATFDMSELLESVDLAKEFVQSGVTHTGLFAAGMLAGGLNLTGESEEDRRRRRAAAHQGAGYVYDPRKIENDFRNAEAIYLDWLPFGLDSYFQVTGEDSPSGEKSMANLHWMLKQFISPMIGIEKFFQTGDYNQILWGFQDAIASFPLINSAGWSDATATFAELTAQSLEHEARGTPDDMSTAFNFALKGMWTLERMLFENSFINMLYVGADKYDRDQYKIPMRDSDGDIQRFGPDNTPRPTEMLTDFVNDDGEVQSGYTTRDWWQAHLHGFAENRATLALVGSLFTGFDDSTMLRQNMVAKTRTFKKPELAQDEAEGLVLSAWDDAIGGAGAEVLTEDGARAVFQGIWKQSVALGSPALDGVFIPYPMREQIQAKWTEQLIQEGLDLGLDEYQAKARMNELWRGPSTNPEIPGLQDILWSDQIPYSPSIKYNQLNTTYVTGPDGMPWATGVTRDSLHNAFGLMPLNRFYGGDVGNLDVDTRLNSVDGAANLNTGLRGLERIDESWYIPTDEEIGESIEKAITKAMSNSYKPNGGGGGGNGWRNFGRRGGGGYSRGSSFFSRLNAPENSQVPYDNSIPFINTSNPIIRRASIRRERFDSDRGRLNQWQ